LANTAEGFDLALSNVMQGQVEFVERGVTFERIKG